MKNKILQEFLNSKLKIKSQEKLEQYIQFCIENNQQEKIKNKTSYHHILPRKLFEKYSSLKENPWNGTHLLHSDHYYTHWLLTEAIDNYSMLNAFCAMHNKDNKLKRIDEKDLISPEEFQKKIEERSIKHSKHLTKKIIINGVETTIAKEAARKTNIKNSKNRTQMNKKMSEQANRKMIIDGEETTMALARAKKRIKTIHKKIIVNGVETTIAKENAKKAAQTLISKGKFYNLFHIEKGLINEKISARDIREMSQGLIKTSKDKVLGRDKRSRTLLKKHRKENLIGLYVEEF